ncbi:MAG: hypothetical protein IT293_20880 [Deltaproteobacteria bacterium]|nr:hypothetical protein [Deltaproteobacteria bacterium]
MSSSTWKFLAAIVACSVLSAGSASAQTCGDADGSGTVTVTDGVQTLRAAAGLGTTCTAAACDVDGSGSITVTDGVNVLRKAAGIPITEACPGTNLGTQVESLLGTALARFGFLTKGGAAAGARAAFEQPCDNDGGFLVIDDQTGAISYDNCELGGIRLDGFLATNSGGMEFGITFTDLATGDFETMSGNVSDRVVGGTYVTSGFFSYDSSSFGAFDIGFDELTVDSSSGNFVGGSLVFSVDDGALEDVETIRLNFNPTNVALVEVTLSDDSVVPFNYDLVSGELTPFVN